MLDDQRALVERLQKNTGSIISYVFFRMVAKGRGGPKQVKPITAFTKAWRNACVLAECPGRIPDDFARPCGTSCALRFLKLSR